jgi:transposase
MQRMCMKPRLAAEIPQDTRQLGQTLLKPDNVLRIISERLSEFIHDEDFADLYPPEGRPAVWPGVLALVTVLQWTEAVSDRQAAYLVVTRLDWKYLLHLPLNYTGFDFSVLSEFRKRLIAHHAEQRVFEKLLEQLKTLGLVRGRGVQRTDSMAVLSAVSRLTRLELIYETLRVTLMAIKRTDAAWFQQMIPQRFVEEYGERGEQERWVKESGEKGHAEVKPRAAQMGQDGQWVLERIDAPDTPPEIRDLTEVATLRTVWAQQFEKRQPPKDPGGGGPFEFELREHVASEGAETICTPHDPETRYSTKRGQEWEGYKLHLTETVDEQGPRIITDIRTTMATTADFDLVRPIQETLIAREVDRKSVV